MKPLQHQIQILKELETKNKALIYIASGAGKTHIIAFDVLQKKPESVLYIVHRNEILSQTIKIFKEVCKIDNSEIGIINGKKKNFEKKYLFTTNMTLARTKNLEKIPKYIEYLIVDEVHHAAAKTYQKIIDNFSSKYLYGLTATPDRHDLQDIKHIFEYNIVGNIDIFTGIQRNILVPFDYRGFYDNIDYTDIMWNGYQYKQNDLDKKLLIENRDKAVIKQYRDSIFDNEENKNRLTIGFCNSVKHVQRMTDKFNQVGIKAAGISYNDSYETRQDILDNFRKGIYKVLFTRDILNEGVDFPECEALMFLRPTYSKVVFFQQLGRGLRKKENKKDVIILDFIGNYNNAYKVRDYLFEMTNGGQITGERFKPEYNHSVPRVFFDERVISIFELQEKNKSRRNPSKDELIKEYQRLTNILGYPPRFEKWQDSNFANLALYSDFQYRTVFGSFSNFYKEINLKQYIKKKSSYCDSKDELIDNYRNLQKILNTNDKLTQNIIDAHPAGKYYSTAYVLTFGSLREFRQYIGEIDKNIPKRYDLEWILVHYKKLAQKLSRDWLTESDWRKEYGKKGLGYMYRHTGGFAGIRERLNIHSMKKICKGCGKGFEIRDIEGKKRVGRNLVTKKFCTLKCGNRWYNKTKYREMRRAPRIKNIIENYSECIYCGKKIEYLFLKTPNIPVIKFSKKRYCSPNCSAKYRYNLLKKQKEGEYEEKVRDV